MKKIAFYKLQASGNDFILIDAFRIPHSAFRSGYKGLAKRVCERKFGVGADGLLVIGRSKKAPFKMRIFNADGSEAQMCANGACCVALWASMDKSTRSTKSPVRTMKFDTEAGVIEAEVKTKAGTIKIKTSDPFGIKLDMPLKVLGKTIKVNFINTGVPHAVIFVEGLEKIDVDVIGRAIRFHKRFQPAGTNVNFVEFLSREAIKIRTYERGVEAETLACGTGSVASAIIASHQVARSSFAGASFGNTQDTSAKDTERSEVPGHQTKMRVKTKGGETLTVYFARVKDKIRDAWLEGKAFFVYKGELKA